MLKLTKRRRGPGCVAVLGGMTLVAGLAVGGTVGAVSSQQETYPVRESDYILGIDQLVEGAGETEPVELEGTTWEIPDEALRSAVVNALYGARLMGKDTSTLRLTVEQDAMQLTELSIPETVESLTGLEKATSLEALEAQPTVDLDLSPLSGLKNLTDLDLSFSEVADISALEDLPLEMLVLSNTPVEDISALEGMSLRLLNLSNTRVTDLSPLSSTTDLQDLYLDSSAVTDVSPLAKTPIRSFFADDLDVKDWNVLKHVGTLMN